jgi:hypothetical protein
MIAGAEFATTLGARDIGKLHSCLGSASQKKLLGNWQGFQRWRYFGFAEASEFSGTVFAFSQFAKRDPAWRPVVLAQIRPPVSPYRGGNRGRLGFHEASHVLATGQQSSPEPNLLHRVIQALLACNRGILDILGALNLIGRA